MSSRSRFGYNSKISSVVKPCATMRTTVTTGMRRPRMQGAPPILLGSMVMQGWAW
jgi:hypothetical protein